MSGNSLVNVLVMITYKAGVPQQMLRITNGYINALQTLGRYIAPYLTT